MIDIDGHAALLRVNFGVGGHGSLRPNDPVPVPGARARAKAIEGITDLCKHLQTPVPLLDQLLPPSLFPESGNPPSQLRHLSKFLEKLQYIRVMDKGAGEMWGFCSAWLWDRVQEFMRNETFVPAGSTQAQRKISKAVRDMNLQRNPKGRFCILYVLAKAKSLQTGTWVFGNIRVPCPGAQQTTTATGNAILHLYAAHATDRDTAQLPVCGHKRGLQLVSFCSPKARTVAD